MPRKEARVQVRISDDLRKRLDQAVDSTGIPEPVIVARCVEAYCDYVEEHGEATFPLIVKPRSAETKAVEPKRKIA